MDAPIRIGIAGAGRMGRAVVAAVNASTETELAGVWTREGDLEALVAAAEVTVDFTLPGATERIAAACEVAGRPLVCGVTGLDAAEQEALKRLAGHVPVVYDRDMSIGIAIHADMVPQVAVALGPDYRVSVSETHHVDKQDAPSGTALKLGEAIEAVTGDRSIAYSSERRGDVPGDHEVRFESRAERISLTHSVVTRDVFAEGAVRAAVWATQQPPGLYQMRHVLSAA